jgi:trehalose/maltose transport system permease protein
MRRSPGLKRAGLGLLLAAVALFCLAPVAWQAVTSLKPEAELTRLPPIFPADPTLDHYRAVLRDGSFLRTIGNSLVVASAATVLALTIGSLGAFALARLGFRGKGAVLGIALAISMFPPVATVSPLYLAVRALGLRDTWTALIVLHTAFALPLTLWVLTGFFRDIPEELYHAARLDGCGPLQAFSKILLPLAAPGLGAAAILAFIFSWNEFLFALTFTTTEASRTVPVGIALFPGLHEIPYGDIAAASLIATLPAIALALLFQRRIAEGLTAGALKG